MNEVRREHMTCQECGENITWSSDSELDENFNGAIGKLVSHMHDVKCTRERKLKIILGTKERLAQDTWLRNTQ